MHWADPTTVELFELLIEAIKELAGVLGRDVAPRNAVRPGPRRPHVTVQQLSGLDDRLATVLIKQVAGGRDLPSDVVERIIAHADSVPLFIEELTNTVLQKKRNDRGRVIVASWFAVRGHGSAVVAFLPDGASRSIVCWQGGCADRRGDRPGVFVRYDAGADAAAGPRLELALAELTQSGIIVAHGQPPVGHLHFQARAGAGRRLCVAAARAAQGDSPAPRRGARTRAGKRRRGAAPDCPALCRGRCSRNDPFTTTGRPRSVRPAAPRWPKWSAIFAMRSRKLPCFRNRRTGTARNCSFNWRLEAC